MLELNRRKASGINIKENWSKPTAFFTYPIKCYFCGERALMKKQCPNFLKLQTKKIILIIYLKEIILITTKHP